MSQHTPGPWVISNSDCFLVRAGNADTGRHIAHVGPANYQPRFDVDEPNAYLIAAVPDLREALDKMLDHFEGNIPLWLFELAEGAIAKARGGQ